MSRTSAIVVAVVGIALAVVSVLPRLHAQTGSPGGVATGLVTWQKGNDGVSTPASWQDSSGNGNHATQSTAGSRPAFVTGGNINFNPGFDFDGTNDFFQFSNALGIGGTVDSSSLVVYREDVAPAAFTVLLGDGLTGSNQFVLAAHATGSFYSAVGGGVGLCSAMTSTTLPVSRPGIASAVRASQNMTLRLNGGGANTGTCTANFTSNPRRLGARVGDYTNGEIAEFIQYNRALTAPELQRIQSYLAIKYGITLDQTTPTNYVTGNGTVIWDAAANATYNKNIVGIGRDDDSSLAQKQSRSVNFSTNSGNYVTMGLGTIAAENTANANTFAADRSFLVFGDNGAATTFTTPIAAPGGVSATTRLARIWRVQETGTIGAVKVAAFKAVADGNPLYLVVSDDPTFDATDQFIPLAPLTVAPTSYLAGDADFTNGQYFTFAMTRPTPGGVSSGVEYWIRPEEMVVTGSSVSNWDDVDDRHTDETMVGGGPAYQATGYNFHPTAAMNGDGSTSGQFLRFTSQQLMTGATAGEIFSMVESTGTHAIADGYPFEFGGGGSAISWQYDWSDSQVYSGWGSTVRKIWNPLSAPAGAPARDVLDPHIFHNASKAGQWTVWFDGLPNFTTATNTVQFNSSNSSHTYIGASHNATFKGRISEVAVFRRELTATERQRVNSYFAAKFGVTLGTTTTPIDYLASDGTTFWTGSATYQNNVAAIGRDDASGLQQRQSKSIHTGALVTMALGAVASDNASNPNNFAADKTYLAWGRNTAGTTQNVAVTGTSLTRIGRIWRVQEVGDAGSVVVRVPRTLVSGLNPVLLRGADTTFDNADTQVPLALNGADYEVSVNFTSGEFFTFASTLPSPGGVTGARMWVRGDLGMSCTTANCTVTQWFDQSGNARHASTTLGAVTRTNGGVNFNPVAAFDATDLMSGPSLLGAGPISDTNIYFVSKKTAVGTHSDLYEAATPTRLATFQPYTDNVVYWDAGDAAGAYRLTAPAGSIVLNTYELKSYNASTTLSQTIPSVRQAIVKNGKVLTSDTTMSSYTGTNANYGLGGHVTTADGAESFAEVIVFTSAVTAVQQQRIHSYLAVKYGITLDQTTATDYVASDGTVIWNGTTNASHKNNIAGIGRDDSSALAQKQSRSINSANSGDLLTIGLGTIAADNETNANAFAPDKSFLTWGDDNGAIFLSTAVPNASGLRRMARVWRAQETGTVGVVQVRVPLAMLPGTNQSLIRSTDAIFDGTDTIVPLTAGASGYEATFDFNSGDYFTFASLPAPAPGGISGGLAVWLKANAGTNVNGSNNFIAPGWQDQSGNNRNASVINGDPQKQASPMNYNPGVAFDGNDYFTFSPNKWVTSFTAGEVFSVHRSTQAANSRNGYPYDFGTNSRGNHWVWDNGHIYDGFGSTDRLGWHPVTKAIIDAKPGVASISGPTFDITRFHLYNARSATNNWGVNIDGATTATSATNGVSFVLGSNEAVGATYNAPFTGVVNEIFLYNRVLTATERQQVHSYLAVKYGATLLAPGAGAQDYLSSTGAAIWNGVANSAYHNEVAGIGRDDASGLMQKQSTAAYTNLQLVIGHGTIAADNVSNPNNIAADQSFLIWGRDSGSTVQSVAVPSSGVTRMARIWRAQETGTVGPVLVRIPATLLTGTQPSLIRSADATFTNTDTLVPLTLNGNYYEVTTDFSGVEFFTFGSIVPEPGGVGGQALWVKADAGLDVNASNQVEQWLDQSASGNTTTELRAALPAHTNAIAPSADIIRVANGVNFNPAVDFTGATGKTLKGNAATQWDTGPLSVFTVSFQEGPLPGGYAGIFASHATWTTDIANGTAGIGVGVGAGRYQLDGSGCTGAITSSPLGAPRLVRGIYTAAGNSLGGSIWMDGVQEATGTNCAGYATTFFEVGGRTAGSATFDNRVLDGKITEVVVYKSVLSATDANKVESYLALKYGITLRQTPSPKNYLDSTAAVIWSGAANATYKNNIAGIGRDDASGLVQRQSKSINGGEFVTIGLGTIASDNISNPNTFANDRNFMIWGHDGASSAWGLAVPGTSLKRMPRVWKVQETGTVGTVVVRVPKTILGGVSPTLFRSTDATFDNSDSQIPLVVNGAFLEATIDFANGNFFTFASADAPAIRSHGDGYITDGTIKGAVPAANTATCDPKQFWEHVPIVQQGVFTGGNLGFMHAGFTGSESTFLADVNDDGKLDILAVYDGGNAAGDANGTWAWLGNGDGTFQTAAIRDTGSYTGGPLYPTYAPFGGGNGNESTHVADVTGDGSVDIVWIYDNSAGANAGTWVWQGNGDGTFQHTPIIDHGHAGGVGFPGGAPFGGYSAAQSTDVVDVNNDGKLDIVWVYDAGYTTNGGVWVWLGSGDGTWQHAVIETHGMQGSTTGGFAFPFSPAGGATANESTHLVDIDKDGFVDLVWVYDGGGSNPAVSGVWVWKGNGNGTFQTTVTRDLGFTGAQSGAGGPIGGQDGNQTTRLVDVNRDGNLDILWIWDGVTGDSSKSGTYVYLGNGNGTFNHTPLNDVGGWGATGSVGAYIQGGYTGGEITLVGDLNGDGVDDILWNWEGGGGSNQALSGTWVWLGNDTDGDGQADIVDPDDDDDGIPDGSDACDAPGSVSPNMTLWLKADAGLSTTASDNVSHWADQTPASRDANLVTGAPLKVEAAVNFNPTVQFDGVDDHLNFGSAGFTSTFTSGETFVVTKDLSPGVGNHGNPFDFGGGSQSLYTWSDGAIYLDFGTTDRFGWNPVTKAIVDAHPGIAAISGPSISTSAYHIYGVHAATNDWGVRFDGATVAATSNNVVSFADTGGAEAIGATTNYIFHGQVAEAILYNRTLTAQERQEVQSYLGTKYGITLGHSYLASDDTTVYWDMAANAAHHNDVAGIGRDDNATLDQRQSGSINTGNILWIGLNEIAATNQTNANAFPTDKMFMMWGHDNASLSQAIQVTGTSPLLTRLARVWKVQETGTVGTTLVRVPLSSVRGSAPVLIRSTNPTFDNSDEMVPLAENGAYYEVPMDFNNGDYFAFAAFLQAPGGVTADLGLWVKANDGPSSSTDGDNVDGWQDRSGNAKDLTVLLPAGAVQPMFKEGSLNFNPAVSLLNTSTSDQALWNQNFLGTTNGNYNIDASALFAHIPRKTANCNGLASLTSPADASASRADHPWLGHCVSNGNQLAATNFYGTPQVNWSGVGMTAPQNVPAINGYTWRYNASGSFSFRQNGTVATPAAFVPFHSGRDFYLLRDGDDNNNDGADDMSEAIVYTRQLTALEFQKVESYLSIKYGLTLKSSSNGPQDYLNSAGTTIWSGVANALYHNDVAGIENDVASALDQRVSQSVNAGDQIAIAAGAFDFVAPITAQSPTATIGDQSALVWGHNAGPLTINVGVTDPAITSAGVSLRMPRVWRTQATGSGLPSQVSILIPATLVETLNPTIDPSAVRLLISPTQDFSAGSRTPITLTKIGAVYTAGFVTFVPGEYFTIATTDLDPPTTTITLAPPTPNGSNGWWITAVNVTVSATDAAGGSGIAAIRCIVDPTDVPADFASLPSGGCAYTGTGTQVTADGAHTIYAAAIDNNGNVSPVVSATFQVDLELPATTISLAPPAPNGVGGFYTSAVQVGVLGTDNVSGVDTVRCVLDPVGPPSTWADLPATPCAYLGAGAPVSAPGTHTIYAATMDAAGNMSSIASTTFSIASTIDLSLTKTVSPASAFLNDPVTFTITVTNPSATAAAGVVVNDLLPAGLSFQSATPSQGTYDGATGAWTVGTLTASQSATLTLNAIVTQTGTLTNFAAIKARDDRYDADPSNNTAVATLNASTAADLAVLKTVDSSAPDVGTNVTFTVTVKNQGPNDATGVAIADALPAGLTLITATPSGGTSYVAPTWTIGTLTNGATATLTIVASVDAAGALVNTAAKSAQTEADFNPANDQSSVTLNAAESANLAIAKSASNSAPAVGEQVTFTVIATNQGPSGATGVVVNDLLPAGLTFVSAVASSGAYDPISGDWAIGAIAPSGIEILTITASVSVTGAITNTASVTTSDQLDPQSTNNSASAVLNAGLTADLAIAKTLTTSPIPGLPASYTIVVTNHGPSPVTGATVTDTVPVALTSAAWTCTADTGSACGAANGTGNISTTVDLQSGDSATFILTGTIAPGATGLFDNTATVAAPGGVTDPTAANDAATSSVTLVPTADIQVTKSGPATATLGLNVAYTITVTNAGPSNAVGVSVADPTPTDLTFVSNTGDCTTAFPCALGTLAPGASRTITATYNVPGGYAGADPIVNTATGSSSTADPSSANNAATAMTAIGAAVTDLGVSKTNGVSTVVPGSQTTYVITVTNAGPSTAIGATVIDNFPSAITGVTWTCVGAGGGICVPSGSGDINQIVDVPVGGTVTFTATGTVAAGATGVVVNTASVTPPAGASDPSSANNTDADTVTPQADLQITKTGPLTIVPGNPLVYTITVTNNGPSNAENVVVADATPAGLTFTSNAGDCATAFPCALGTINSGQSKAITATFAMPANYAGANPIVNTASVFASTTDPTPGNDEANASTTLNLDADIEITKSTSPGAVLVGDTVTVTVGAKNNGPNPATGIEVTDALPAGFAFVSAAPTQGAYDQATGKWTVGSLAPSATASLVITTTATQPGSITNLAVKTGQAGPDPNSANDSAGSTTNAAASADVGIEKTVDQAAPLVGNTVTFTVTATNRGPNDATNLVIADALPSGLTLVTATPSQGSYVSGVWTVGTVANGASATMTIAATVDVPGALVNNASVSSQDQADPDPLNNSDAASVNAAANSDLRVTKAVSNAAPGVGEQVTYTIAVTNLGPSPATSAAILDTLPAGLTYVSSTASTGTYDPGSGVWTINTTIPSTGTETLSITAQVTALGALNNTASRQSSSPIDPNAANDSGSASSTPQLITDLGITKTLTTGAIPGLTASYTIIVTNNGPSPIAGATVGDTFPAIFTGAAWTCAADPGSACAAPGGSGDIATTVDLEAGDQATFTVTGTIAANATGTLANTATVAVPGGATDPVSANDSATSSVSLAPLTDLQITKSGPATVSPGTNVVYTITVINNGPSDAAGTAVADPTPAGLTFVSNTGACTTAFPCALGVVPAGATLTITSTFSVPASYTAPNPIVNTATVSTTTTDAVPTNDSSSAQTTLAPQSDLSITKAGTPTVLPGGTVVYTLTIGNAGPSNATGVMVSDPTPAGLTFVSNTGDCTSAFPCALGALPVGAPRTITATFSVPSNYAGASPIANTADVSSAAGDPATANNTDTAQTIVNRDADVEITKSVSPSSVLVGGTVTVTIGAINHGPNPATSVEITDLLPAGFSFVSSVPTQGSYDAVTGKWDVGTIASSGSATLQITATATLPGSITNVATKTAQAEPDPNSSNDTAGAMTNAAAAADVTIDKTVDNAAPLVGATVTFTVHALNRGPNPVTGLVVGDALPAGLTLVTATPSQGSYSAGVWNVGSVAVGVDATLTITATADVPGALVNNASVTSQDQPDPNVLNNSDAVSLNAAANSDLRVAKAVSKANPGVGEQVTYAIAVTNLGPSDATSATITDMMPAGITFVSAAASEGTYNPGTGEWTLGPIPVNVTRTLSITATVSADTGATNTAARQTSGPIDPNAANDSGSASTSPVLISDMVVAKALLTPPIPGLPAQYRIVVTNNGPSPIAGATVADTLPAALTGASWTCTADAGSSCTAANGTGDISTTVNLEAGDSATFIVDGLVPSGTTGTLANTATAGVPVNVTDPDNTNDSSTSSVALTPTADIQIAKTGPATVVAGNNVTYTITVTNAGPSDALGVSVADPTPAGLIFVSNTGDCVTAFPCTLGTMTAGTVRTITTTYTVPGGYAGADPIVNVATASSTTTDPSSANNTATSMTSIGAPVTDLGITKTNGVATVVPGSTTTYTITVTNAGPTDAVGATVTDLFPSALTGVTWTCVGAGGGLCPASGSGNINTTVTVPVGATVTFSATGTVSASATGLLVNTASVTPPPGASDPSSANNTDADTVTPNADLAITKTGNPSVLPGGSVVYTITVTNNGPSNAESVVVSDLTPAGLTFTSNAGDCTTAFPCSLGTIPSGGTRTITATYSVPLSYAGPSPFVNTATVSSATADSDGSNDSASASTLVNRDADVEVTKSMSPASVLVGDTVTVTIGAINNGPNPATSIEVTDLLPAGFAFVSATPTQGTYGSATGKWTVGTLSASSSAQLVITATATAPGSITNLAVKTGQTEPDPNPSNDSAGATTNAAAAADITIDKTVDRTDPLVSETVTFTVHAQNRGPNDATGVVVSDALPSGLTLVTATPSHGSYAGGVWTVGNLTVGEDATLTLVATVDAPGALVNNASVTTSGVADPNPLNNSDAVSVNAAANSDLRVTKAVSKSNPGVGEQVTYTVAVTNLGPSDLTSAQISEALPAGVTFVSATTSQGTYDSVLGVWTLGAIPVSATETLSITVQITDVGAMANTATRQSSSPIDPNPANDSGTAGATSSLIADLSISKVPSGPTATAGGPVFWTIVVANNGPSTATNAAVMDAFPAAFTGGVWSCTTSDPASTCAAPSGAGSIATTVTLKAGHSATFAISGTVAPTASGVLNNTATVAAASGTTDPDGSNNSATGAVTLTVAADVSLTKAVVEPTVLPGQTFTYRLTVANAGPSTATGVTVSDTLPAQVSFVSSPFGCTAAGQTVTCPAISTLTAGTPVAIDILAKLDPSYTGNGSDVANIASVSTTSTDPTPSNNTTPPVVLSVGAPAADLSTAKAALEPEVTPGMTFTYRIVVTNNGPSTATNVRAADPLPSPLAFVSSTSGCTSADQNVSCGPVASVLPGASAVFEFVVKLDPAYAGNGSDLANTATGTSDTIDPDPSNNINPPAPPPPVTAPKSDVQMVKSVSSAQVLPGQNYTYTLNVRNNGPSVATGVVATDTLPLPTTFVSSPNGCTAVGQSVTCPTVATLAVGANVTFDIVVKLDAAYVGDGSNILNSALVMSATSDPAPANNSSPAGAPPVGPPGADVAVVKNVTTAPVTPGGFYVYTLMVANQGPSVATNVVVSDPLPAGVLFVGSPDGCTAAPLSGGRQNVTCPAVASLAPGASATFTIDVQLDPSYAGNGSDIQNRASVVATELDPVPTNNVSPPSTPIVGTPSADLSLTKSVVEASVLPGQTFTYRLVVSNAGPSTALGVTVTDVLPSQVAFVHSPSFCTAITSGGTQTVTCPPVSLAVGASATFDIVVRLDTNFTGTNGDVVNTATVTSLVPDPNPTNNATPPTVAPPIARGEADVIIEKKGPIGTVPPNSNATWTIVVTNQGPNAAENVVVQDPTPAGLTFVGTSGDCATAFPCALGKIEAGQVKTIEATYFIPSSVTGVVVNTATVTSGTPDPTPINNSASAQTPPDPIHYYLSEGATGSFFDTDVLIANPNTAPAPVTLTFFREDGQVFTEARTVPAQSRLTVKVEELPGLEFTTMSIKVTSDLGYPLAVERTMSWDPRYYGGHTATAVPSPATRWYFGEGSQGFFDTYLLLENDHPNPVEVTITFLREAEAPFVKKIVVAATSRYTVQVATIPEMGSRSFGMVVDATESIVAERAMYFGNTPTRIWTGGHSSAGVTALSRRWFHPEGATGAFFDTFILMSNPQDVDAHVSMEFILPSGEVITLPKTIPAKTRLTINPEVESDPRLKNASISTRVLSDVPIVSERSMYWVGDTDVAPWGEAHNSFGLTDSAIRQALGEGRVGGPLNYTTYILLSNPWEAPAEVKVTFLRETGAPVVKTWSVPPTTRFNIDANNMVPELRNESFGAFIEVTNGYTITVERSLYWDANGIFWGGGTNAPATRIP